MEIRFHFHSSHLNCAPCMHLVSRYITRVKQYIGKGISQCSKGVKKYNEICGLHQKLK